MLLSQRALKVTGSLTLKIDALAKQMKAEGKNVIGFGAGEPDFTTPDYIMNAAREALDMGLTRYTPASGRLDFKQVICDKIKKDNGVEYRPENIVVSNGAKHSLFNVFQAILDPGDEVIIPTPYWVSYPEMVKLCYGTPVFVETFEEDGFLAKAENIEKLIGPRTKAIILNSPSNPCGAVYSREELEKIAEVAKKYNVLVIADEIYSKLVYEGEHISIASIDEEIKFLTIIVNGLSKAYAMTGWRIGYIAAPKAIAAAIGKMQSHETSNPNSIAQYAGIVALRDEQDEVEVMRAEFDERRKLMVSMINDIDYVSCVEPKGAFYVMLNISEVIGRQFNGIEIMDSMQFASLLLEHECVAVVPGVAFGADNYVRLSYAVARDKIETGLNRIKSFIEKTY